MKKSENGEIYPNFLLLATVIGIAIVVVMVIVFIFVRPLASAPDNLTEAEAKVSVEEIKEAKKKLVMPPDWDEGMVSVQSVVSGLTAPWTQIVYRTKEGEIIFWNVGRVEFVHGEFIKLVPTLEDVPASEEAPEGRGK